MASAIGDAHQVEHVANVFDEAARELVHVGRDQASNLENAQWQAPVADRERSSAREQRSRAEQAGQDLLDIARALRRHATWIRERESELRSLEARIRAWAAAHPPDPTSPLPDASLITYWPPPLSTEWEDLASRLRANGAYF